MADLSTQPYKGTRDVYPEDMRVRNYIFNVWRTVASRYGYEEYDAPLIEPTELYRAKSGEEIINEQTYSFTDRGGREVTIRPEMTPSLARMVAAKQQELTLPLRWFCIVPNWRYERPQRGRSREFWQFNVDLLGVSNVEADAEVIRVADSVIKAFGATDDMFEIRINNRKLTSVLLGEYLGLDIQQSHLMAKLLDRKAKMSDEAFASQAKAIMGEDVDKLLELLSVTDIANLPAAVVESGQVEELRQLMEKLKGYGISNAKFDLTIMRGFDYYTGMVFEVFDTNAENPRSVFGGGRYDELTGIFNAPNIPAVGFAPSDISMQNFLETHQLLPKAESAIKAYVVVVGDNVEEAQKLAKTLRQAGINIAVDLTDRKAGDQLKKPIKDNIPFAIFVGEEEVSSKQYTLKDLTKESEQKLTAEQLIKELT